MGSPDATDGVSISEAMESLRQQVQAAASRPQQGGLLFDLKQIEVEFQVELTTKVQGSATVKLWTVLTARAGAERARSNTHRVRLTLEPHLGVQHARPGAVPLSDEDED
ncbi:trypco2 family protein [Actinomadura macra]|uniref:trypco2 family protein n=1 Tax=Actinomadura macra TaxID=46164 RepID=UPI000836A40C|nr:trypco2 family protein [Actinomadura macra]